MSIIQFKEHFFRLPEPARFVLVGGYNTAIGYLCFLLIFLVAGNRFHYQLVLLLAYLISSISAFFMLKYFVFLTKGNHLREYIKTVSTYCFSYLLNAGILYFLVEKITLNVLLSQALSVGLVTVISYLMHKNFSFRAA